MFEMKLQITPPKELLLHMLILFTTPHKMVNIIHPLFGFADDANILLVIVTGLLLTLPRHWSFCATAISLFQPASSLVFLCGSHYFVDFLTGLHTSMDCTLLQISNNVIQIESIFKLNYTVNFT